ncbi:RNA polymerase sigma factor [Nocardia sp. NPDC057030]|uniref:RNA polymerase sigma factor n=1 Tax=unclassified Nocardia TaxID=2637762 RepID=UPI00362E2E7E
MIVHADVEVLLRELAPRLLGTLVRRFGDFDLCEDAGQEAMFAAVVQWPSEGIPDKPLGWLVTVAGRRLTDQLRSEDARRRREATVAAMTPADELLLVQGPDNTQANDQDDTLVLLFLCCHPALSAASQVALTLRALGGLSTAQIAKAFLVPESTMAQRISRAKQSIKAAGSGFRLQPTAERTGDLHVVLQVLYLIFNEGYTATTGSDLQRCDLTGEAIRLARQVHRTLPDNGEVVGLLALMLFTEARRRARVRSDGSLVPLAEQDRELWDRDAITEGLVLISDALSRFPLGPYQLQAAIAAIHAEAACAADTDWLQISALYRLLEQVAPNPVVTLNRAVAVAMAQGPKAGLTVLTTLDEDSRMTGHHRLHAVRAHLLEMDGDYQAARDHYQQAARRTTSIPEQRYLYGMADRLA